MSILAEIYWITEVLTGFIMFCQDVAGTLQTAHVLQLVKPVCYFIKV